MYRRSPVLERWGDRRRLIGMVREPPGPVLIATVSAVCAIELFASGNLGGGLRVDLFLLAFGSAFVGLVWLVMIGIAYRRLQKTWTAALRVFIGPVLLLGSFALVGTETPMRVRFELSKPSLNAYMRTLRRLPVGVFCDPSTFEKRRVGLFNVSCADRPNADSVAIIFEQDVLTPTSQEWYLVWERTQDPETQDALDSHWALGMED